MSDGLDIFIAGVFATDKGYKVKRIDFNDIPPHVRIEKWLKVADLLEGLAEEIREICEVKEE